MAIIFDNIYDPKEHLPLEEYTIDNVQSLGQKEWTVNLTAYEIAKLWDEKKLVYYPNTQRGVKTVTVSGETKLVAIFNYKRVSEIQRAIMNERYFSDQMTINIITDISVLKNQEGIVCYDDNTEKLTIMNGLMCMLDGQHRTKAAHNIYQNMNKLNDKNMENILKNLKFSIKITNHDVDTAAAHFVQLAKGEKISTSRAESFDRSEAANRIINRLNESGTLKHMIDTTKTSIPNNDPVHIVTFSTMVNAFKDVFPRIDDEKTEKSIGDFLNEFFKQLFLLYPEMKTHQGRLKSKTAYMTCENFMFYGYMALAAYLYNLKDENWIEIMQNMKNINLNKDMDLWETITKTSKNGRTIINNASTRRELRIIYLNEFRLLEMKKLG